jgi:hypothetical protein
LDVVEKSQNAFNSKICNYHVKQPNTMGFDMSERPPHNQRVKTNLKYHISL